MLFNTKTTSIQFTLRQKTTISALSSSAHRNVVNEFTRRTFEQVSQGGCGASGKDRKVKSADKPVYNDVVTRVSTPHAHM